MRRYALRRLLRAVVVTYLVLSVTIVAFGAATSHARVAANPRSTANVSAEGAQFLLRQAELPLHQKYVLWLSRFLRLDFGYSLTFRMPVADAMGEILPVTFLYAGSAVAVAGALTLLTGVVAALRPGGGIDWFGRVVSWFGFGVPAFVLAEVLVQADRRGLLSVPLYDEALGLFAPHNLAALAVPAALLALSLYGAQWRAVRSESRSVLDEQFVKTLRANGASGGRLGRHVLRNAVPPLLALFGAEAMTVLLLSVVFIEPVLGIPGYGTALLAAFINHDMALLLTEAMVAVVLGVAINAAQDVAIAAIDPRIDPD